MDRAFWLSLMLVALSIALVTTGRALMDSSESLGSASLLAEIDALEGRPSSLELADRVTESAGCIRGLQPELRSCWYVWAVPSRPDYLRVVAARVNADSTASAVAWGAISIIAWVFMALTAWKAYRRRPPARPRAVPPRMAAKPPPGRLVP